AAFAFFQRRPADGTSSIQPQDEESTDSLGPRPARRLEPDEFNLPDHHGILDRRQLRNFRPSPGKSNASLCDYSFLAVGGHFTGGRPALYSRRGTFWRAKCHSN